MESSSSSSSEAPSSLPPAPLPAEPEQTSSLSVAEVSSSDCPSSPLPLLPSASPKNGSGWGPLPLSGGFVVFGFFLLGHSPGRRPILHILFLPSLQESRVCVSSLRSNFSCWRTLSVGLVSTSGAVLKHPCLLVFLSPWLLKWPGLFHTWPCFVLTCCSLLGWTLTSIPRGNCLYCLLVISSATFYQAVVE